MELPLRAIFENPTIGGLADAIARLKERVGGREAETIVPVRREQFGVSMHFAPAALDTVEESVASAGN
jgi:hypothetical protein